MSGSITLSDESNNKIVNLAGVKQTHHSTGNKKAHPVPKTEIIDNLIEFFEKNNGNITEFPLKRQKDDR